ncbi:MAG TPA: arginine--tRNA ligase [Solirubrobacteraceae bacterium]|jgi:arginyl-tRNA synthetase
MPPSTSDRPDIAQLLAERVVGAAASALEVQIAPEQAVIREAGREWEFDYQSNAAMALAKRLGRPSRELAEQLVATLQVEDICEPPSVAGPGFINLRLRADWLGERAAALLSDPRLGVPVLSQTSRVVIDYSAPNVAKEMHVGHLRSTIIGDALARLLRFRGHEVIAQNHVGDWGTPFGMLIEHLLDEGGAELADEHAIGDLGDFYKAARVKFDGDEEFAERSRRRVVSLQGGDEETLTLWRALVAESERHFQQVYDLLGVELGPQNIVGESAYDAQLADVAAELVRLGLAIDSDGALCVFPQGFTGREGQPLPLIVRKSDGAYSYDTTDLAALRHRVRELDAGEIVYVVGAPQRLHFELVFAVGHEAGWLREGIEAQHVAFGSVLGEDGKMLRTRSGEPVRLIDLLEESVQRAGKVLEARGPLDGTLDAQELAREIGVGAVKYADLCSDREKDYVFSFERMLSLEGNTSVYLQYANARACSVLRRGEAPHTGPVAIALEQEPERELALALLRLPSAIEATLADMRPHKLTGYLYGLAGSFSAFYEACPILNAPTPQLRASRLALCQLSSAAITLGLSLLGIEAPQEM